MVFKVVNFVNLIFTYCRLQTVCYSLCIIKPKQICHAKNRNETVAKEALQKKPPSQIPHPQTHTTAGLAQTLKGTYLWLDLRGSIFGPQFHHDSVLVKTKKVTEIKDVATWCAEWHAEGGGRQGVSKTMTCWGLLVQYVLFFPAETKQWRRQVKHAGSEGGSSECSTALEYDLLERTTVKVPPLKVVPKKWQHKKGRCKKRKIWLWFFICFIFNDAG